MLYALAFRRLLLCGSGLSSEQSAIGGCIFGDMLFIRMLPDFGMSAATCDMSDYRPTRLQPMS
jgi:hypothetical protein